MYSLVFNPETDSSLNHYEYETEFYKLASWKAS